MSQSRVALKPRWARPLATGFLGVGTLLPLPARAPELNPVENLRQFMRDNWLGNRVFKSYADILDHCCEALNSLIDRPWRIMSIGLRAWAHGS